MPRKPQILVVGASPILRELSEMLAASGHFGVDRLDPTDSPAPESTSPACVLTDPANAAEALRRFRSNTPVVVSGHGLDLAAVTHLMRTGAADYLEWPVSRVRLTQSLRRAIAPAQHAHT